MGVPRRLAAICRPAAFSVIAACATGAQGTGFETWTTGQSTSGASAGTGTAGSSTETDSASSAGSSGSASSSGTTSGSSGGVSSMSSSGSSSSSTSGATSAGSTTGTTGTSSGTSTGGSTSGTTSGSTTGGGSSTGTTGGAMECQVIFADFDSGPMGFVGAGTANDWAHGVPTSGPNADHGGGGSLWATDLSGNANTCEFSTLTSSVVDLSAHMGKTVMLRIWHWYDFRGTTGGLGCSMSESYSGGIVEADGGSGWVKIVPVGGYDTATLNCTGGNGTCGACDLDGVSGAFTGYGSEKQWVMSEFDISAYASATARLRFVFGSHDGYACYPNSAGWYVDDVEIYTVGPC